ncbi:MAG: chemotaxis protein CheD [Acidobacteria bacterium]|nr:chemotaxis protein CheD [Acidobacteriota bacterium]MCB9399381.1 chemotaxis protein CheD [Acidobacteriota bacterium]
MNISTPLDLSVQKPQLVGMGDFQISRNTPLKSVSLGGCVSLIFVAPPIAGMANVVLPDSSLDRQKSTIIPGFFADSAVAKLHEGMLALAPEPQTWCIALVGGGQLAHPRFRLGEKIANAIIQQLKLFGLQPHKQDLGGNESKIAVVSPSSGEITVERPGGLLQIL